MLILFDFEKTPKLREMEIDVESLRRKLEMLALYEEAEPSRRQLAKSLREFLEA
jgi:hypothetical protein